MTLDMSFEEPWMRTPSRPTNNSDLRASGGGEINETGKQEHLAT